MYWFRCWKAKIGQKLPGVGRKQIEREKSTWNQFKTVFRDSFAIFKKYAPYCKINGWSAFWQIGQSYFTLSQPEISGGDRRWHLASVFSDRFFTEFSKKHWNQVLFHKGKGLSQNFRFEQPPCNYFFASEECSLQENGAACETKNLWIPFDIINF